MVLRFLLNIRVILLIGSISFGFFTLSSCEKEDIPVPFHGAVDQETRDLYYFKTGSWWVYESNDGLYDTVTVTSYWIDTFRFVDNNDNLISTQEYFSFTYSSTYRNTAYTIYRNQNSGRKTVIAVHVLTKYGDNWNQLISPNEVGKTYHGVHHMDYFTITDKRDTTINSVTRKLWSIDYNCWYKMSEDLPVKVEMIGGVGMTKMETEFENRTWNLIDSKVFL